MPESEAEALLRHGALYPIRLGLRPIDGRPMVFAGLKHGAVSLYFGDEPSYHFDLEGRWERCFVDPSHFLRRLNGSTQAIDRPRVGRNMVLDRRTLDEAEAAALDASIRSMAASLVDQLEIGAVELVPPPPPARPIGADDLRAILGRIAGWDADAWAGHRRRYRDCYGPIPFLPPDSLEAMVLQATIGPWEDGSRVVRTAEAFARHCREVDALLGRGVVSYRTLFLAGPDVLRRPAEEVEAYLLASRGVFPMAEAPAPARRSDLPVDRPHRDGFHAFVGRSEGPIPVLDDWARFRALGLTRVAFGVEAGEDHGSDDTSTPPDEVPMLVEAARRAGIAVSLVTWIGPDDRPGIRAAADGPIAMIRSLGLGRGDHVYVVDGRERPGASADRQAAGPVPEREAAVMAALEPLRRESGVKVLPYRVSKQGR